MRAAHQCARCMNTDLCAWTLGNAWSACSVHRAGTHISCTAADMDCAQANHTQPAVALWLTFPGAGAPASAAREAMLRELAAASVFTIVPAGFASTEGVASGADTADACGIGLASSAAALTVSATDDRDVVASGARSSVMSWRQSASTIWNSDMMLRPIGCGWVCARAQCARLVFRLLQPWDCTQITMFAREARLCVCNRCAQCNGQIPGTSDLAPLPAALGTAYSFTCCPHCSHCSQLPSTSHALHQQGAASSGEVAGRAYVARGGACVELYAPGAAITTAARSTATDEVCWPHGCAAASCAPPVLTCCEPPPASRCCIFQVLLFLEGKELEKAPVVSQD